jgi:hypothetical protein
VPLNNQGETMTHTTEIIESYMLLMPSGIPVNVDTWYKLCGWIERNIHIAEGWKSTPLTIDEEEKIYNIFGCHSPITHGYVK